MTFQHRKTTKAERQQKRRDIDKHFGIWDKEAQRYYMPGERKRKERQEANCWTPEPWE